MKPKRGSECVQRMVDCLESLLGAGAMCANVCFNLSQRDNMSEADKSSMRESCRAWDKSSLEAYRQLKKLKKANK